MFSNDINFSDLPDLSSFDKDEMTKRSFLTKLNKLDEISNNMQYDEKLQSLLYRQKNIKCFNQELRQFNHKVNKKIAMRQMKLMLPVPEALQKMNGSKNGEIMW